ncbi:hypothetical protein A9Q68_02650 [Streptococcus bovimastitidis]|uniref:VWFA domain-containing protein n=1 Tax=Streptococcus bovimastitidis TaxID=1856638 RepID=A0A1L8MNY4_9STRE|nr:VWA domain-containing protein [Streptococcus bovimastitidis]OJF72461.1 hypothetical protein A9Q68_02650 [Streptococcus bovimastitidis]
MENNRNANRQLFSFRKCQFGLASVLLGLSFISVNQTVNANEVSGSTEIAATELTTDLDTLSDNTVVTEDNLINGQTASEVANIDIENTINKPVISEDKAVEGDIVSISETPSDITESTEETDNEKVVTYEGSDVVKTTTIVKEVSPEPAPVVTNWESEVTYQDGGKIVNDYEKVIKTTTVEYIKGEDIVTNTQVDTADIVFIIDHTYSMDPSIEAVKNNVKQFVNTLAAKNLKVRLGLIDYADAKDVNYHNFNNSKFTNDVSAFITALDSIVIDGGTEEPTVPLSYISEAGNYDWLNDNRFAILITDEDMDFDTNGTPSSEETIKKLKMARISTTIIADSYVSGDYTGIEKGTGGKIIDLDSDFSDTLTKDIANWVVTTVNEGKVYKVVTDSYEFYIEITTSEIPATTPGNNYPAKPVLTGLHTPQASYNLKVTATDNKSQLPHTGQENSQIVLYMGIMMATSSLVLGKKNKKDRE